MKYPTLDEVNKADRSQICRWHRFLPSPGSESIGTPQFEDSLIKEKKILDRIFDRFKEVGGFTPSISKKIGW